MKYYLAPMEGVTGRIFRKAYHACFPAMDKYFAPFITPNENGMLSFRDQRELSMEENQGLSVVPQILTNQADGFIHTARTLKKMGYTEVNLNLGCPSGTVVSKNRGSGFLAFPEEYPLKELIIHPRIQKDFYKNSPRMKCFREGFLHSHAAVCYNGDIFTLADYEKLTKEYPALERVMLGRGLVANPGLGAQIQTGCPGTKENIRNFHNHLYQAYQELLLSASGERVGLFKMKESWGYMIFMFSDSKKWEKKIKKAQSLKDYEAAVSSLFRECEFCPASGYGAKGE